MFDLSVEKILVLAMVALFVLGPERLPGAAAWAGTAIRRAKGFAAGASEQWRAEIGPEMDQLRQPLADLHAPLQQLRALRDPRGAVLRHVFAGAEDSAADGPTPQPGAETAAVPHHLGRNTVPPINNPDT